MRFIILLFFLFPFFVFSQINETDVNGLRQGFWQKKQANGKLLYQGNFKDGKPVGEWRRFHEGGQVKAIINYDGENARTILFDEGGKKVAQGNFVNQKKEGHWIYFAEQKKAFEEQFLNGEKNGISKKYYESGELLEEADWINGTLEGKYQVFFKNGEPYLQCKMANNQRNGLCLIYFLNGKAELEANYKNGLRHNEWKYYNENGEFLYSLHYDEGELLNPEVRDSLDNIEMQNLEKGKSTLIDPEKFMENPSEYMMKMNIHR